jgi:hypothetical protein
MMTLQQKQLAVWGLVALVIALGGIWYGEKPSGFGGSYMLLFLSWPFIIALMFVLNFIMVQKWYVHFLMGLFFLILLLVSFSIGQNNYHDAFNDCVDNGEKVRLVLQAYYQKNKAYPKTLAELNTALPGNLILHPNLLQYETTKAGYLLRFDDHFIAFEATEGKAFEANK